MFSPFKKEQNYLIVYSSDNGSSYSHAHAKHTMKILMQ